MTDIIKWLEQWFEAQCDAPPGEETWAEEQGITISTFAPPGWSVRIDITNTTVESAEFDKCEEYLDTNKWIRCYKKQKEQYGDVHTFFIGRCGPSRLADTLNIFRAWAEANGTSP